MCTPLHETQYAVSTSLGLSTYSSSSRKRPRSEVTVLSSESEGEEEESEDDGTAPRRKQQKKNDNVDKFSDRLSTFIDRTSSVKEGHSPDLFLSNESNIAAYGWHVSHSHTEKLYILTTLLLNRAADAVVFEEVTAAGNTHH